MIITVALGEKEYRSTLQEQSLPPAGPTLPAGLHFARLPHDYEIYGVSRPTHNSASLRTEGLPETVKAIYPKFMPLTRAWQEYWADLFSLSRFNRLFNDLSALEKTVIKVGFKSVTAGYRAFTNRRGWDDGYADYLNGTNTNSDPIEQETIIMGGNVVELLSGKVRTGGKDAYKVRTLDGNKPPPDPMQVNQFRTPWLVFKATISRRERIMVGDVWTGKWKENIVIPFDQLQGHDVPIPFMGDGEENYIEAGRIQPLPDSAPVPRVYHP